MIATPRRSRSKVRYAVIGLGHIAQTAILPAIAHARRCELAALISDDDVKRNELGDRYHVEHRFSEYDQVLASGTFDAIYIALPNHLHCEYTVSPRRPESMCCARSPWQSTRPSAKRCCMLSRPPAYG
jgi:glucose-fructose oxidoreductase